MNTGGVHAAPAKPNCAKSDQTYKIARGNTLSGIAARYHMTTARLASYNHIAKPNLIYAGQYICIPGKNPPPSQQHGAIGTGNYFPYGQCTWWANQRYHELHGVYVPWTTQSDAWQWTARANQFGWHVSTIPHAGDIIDLQPWVQGAYAYGHVAVVERVLSNGHVLASTMNWAPHPQQVLYVEYAPGPGVTFISY